jgi:hypothetical protein
VTHEWRVKVVALDAVSWIRFVPELADKT